MIRFTAQLLKDLSVKNDVYIKSMQMCPAHMLQKAQEHAILSAYSEFYELQAKNGDGNIGIEPVTENTAKMAEVDYQVKMAQLQNSGKKRSELDQLVERYKIEDYIFDTHRVETEHFLLLKKD